MTKKRTFVIPTIEDEPEKKKPQSKFVSPYGGSNTKDEIVYPHVKYDNGGRQYQGLDSSKDDLRVISPESVKINKEDKYNPDRIPSYYRRETDSGIKKSNLADLKGEGVNREEELERNRRTYGTYYRDYQERMEKKVREENNTPKVEVRKEEIKNPLYEEVIIDDKEEVKVEEIKTPEVREVRNNEPKFVHVNDEVEKRIVDIPKNYETPKPNNSFDRRNSYNDVNNSNNTFNTEKRKKSDYKFPPLELLDHNGRTSNGNQNEINYQISVINKELEDFKIGGKVIAYTKGPTVTQFEVKLDPGVNVSKINSINKNLQMDLQCTQIRIEAPIPGKATVGIEVPNVTRDMVLFGDMLSNDIDNNLKKTKTRNGGKPLDCILGLSICGDPTNIDIADMPHGIVAGTTGSGKTICLYSMILSMIYKSTPDEVKIILVDPKRNEFTFFEDIPHLATPIIDDPKLATATLKWCVDEMDRRYDFLKANRKRSISDYNEYARENGLNTMPYIVVIIDEFADLMNTASDSLEVTVQRLTQKARSIGIHLIIATQRPSTDVISGTIKNNISCRIALTVKSFVDSQTILDHSGAEKLLFKGDMLLNRGNSDVRVQGAWVSPKELDRIAQYFIDANFKTDYMFTHDDIRKQAEQIENSSENDVLYDPMFEEVARFVVRNHKCSANQIINTYQMGFNKANRIVLGLAELGIVSSQNIQGKARDVLVNDLDELENILMSRYE